MAMSLYTPTGTKIVGTLERITAVAMIEDVRSVFDFDYNGITQVDWDSQKTLIDSAGRKIFVDEDGLEWSENLLEWR